MRPTRSPGWPDGVRDGTEFDARTDVRGEPWLEVKTALAESKAETFPKAVSRHAAAAIEGGQGGLDAVLRAHPAFSIAGRRDPGARLSLGAIQCLKEFRDSCAPA